MILNPSQAHNFSHNLSFLTFCQTIVICCCLSIISLTHFHSYSLLHVVSLAFLFLVLFMIFSTSPSLEGSSSFSYISFPSVTNQLSLSFCPSLHHTHSNLCRDESPAGERSITNLGKLVRNFPLCRAKQMDVSMVMTTHPDN